MRVINKFLSDVFLIELDRYDDERGSFWEGYNQAKFELLLNKAVNFAQDNHSISHAGVLRGLHAQSSPCAQAKLVQVVSGSIFDVVVDLRPESASFRQWQGIKLDADKAQLLWIPEGFAHGFLTLSNQTHVIYKVTNPYSPDHEIAIAWNDPDLAIQWPFSNTPILSPRDQSAANLGMRHL